MTRSDSVDEIFYLVVETGFENGTANLLLELVMEEGNWKINRFGLQAQALTI